LAFVLASFEHLAQDLGACKSFDRPWLKFRPSGAWGISMAISTRKSQQIWRSEKKQSPSKLA
jgi:hypothetical protein